MHTGEQVVWKTKDEPARTTRAAQTSRQTTFMVSLYETRNNNMKHK